MGLAQSLMGNFEEGVPNIRKSIEIARTGEHSLAKFAEAWGNWWLGYSHMMRGEWKDARDAFGRTFEINQEVGHAWINALAVATGGWATAMSGEFEKGRRQLNEGIQQLDAVGQPIGRHWAYGAMAEICCLVGKFDDAKSFGQKGLGYVKSQDVFGESMAFRALAMAGAEEEKPDWGEIDRLMSESIGKAESEGRRPDISVSRFRYAEILAKKGDLDGARAELRKAAELFSDMEMTWWREQAENLETNLSAR
jgi:tetratricopeptide (TPR) repeat protein